MKMASKMVYGCLTRLTETMGYLVQYITSGISILKTHNISDMITMHV